MKLVIPPHTYRDTLMSCAGPRGMGYGSLYERCCLVAAVRHALDEAAKVTADADADLSFGDVAERIRLLFADGE